jgi:hypothetical protein
MLYEKEYMPQAVSSGAGFRVTVSTPGERPNPTEEGFYVQPGTEVDLSFRLQTISRQPAPYESLCWDDWTATDYQPLYFDRLKNETKVIEDYSYSVSTLSHSCFETTSVTSP